MAVDLVRKLSEAQEQALVRLGQAQEAVWMAQEKVRESEWELVQARAGALALGKALAQAQAGEKVQVQVVVGEWAQDSVRVLA